MSPAASVPAIGAEAARAGAGGAEAVGIEDAVVEAGRGGGGVVELDVLHLDVDGAERDGAGGERLNDATILTSSNVPAAVWPVVVSTDSQLAPEKVAASA